MTEPVRDGVVPLSGYLAALRRRWWVPIGVALVVGGMAVAATAFVTPQYRSTVKLVAVHDIADAGAPRPAAAISPVQRVKSYEELITGPRVARAVITALDLDMSAEELVRRTEAEAVEDTVVLVVSVTDTDPGRAQAIAAAIGDQFPRLLASLDGPVGGGGTPETVSVFEPAALPTRPASPRRVLIVGLAVVLGYLTAAAMQLRRVTRARDE